MHYTCIIYYTYLYIICISDRDIKILIRHCNENILVFLFIISYVIYKIISVHKCVHKRLKLSHGIVKRLFKVIQGDWRTDTNHFKKTIFIFTQKQFNFNDDENSCYREVGKRDGNQFQEML